MERAMGIPGAIRLEVGEPMFATPPHIVEAAVEAARAGYTRYTANAGIPSVREAAAERLRREYAIDLPMERICISVGGVGALATALRVATDVGDEVLIPDPGWPTYVMTVGAAGAIARRYPLHPANGFLPVVADLEQLVGPRTKAIIINSPSNPLGTVLARDKVKELTAWAARRELFLIADEVYDSIVFEGAHASFLAEDGYDGLVVVFAVSKTYAMTGWRIGYAVAPREVSAQMAKMQEASVACAPGVSQKAAEAALRGPQDCVREMCLAYRKNRDVAMQILDHHGISYQRPGGAFYLWVEAGCPDSMAFADDLLATHGVAVAPGETFGPAGRHYVRVSLASPEAALREGVTRLAKAVLSARC
jgi:aspartate aminotransferase/aminotransferase